MRIELIDEKIDETLDDISANSDELELIEYLCFLRKLAKNIKQRIDSTKEALLYEIETS